jgi:hypothetical protein
LQSATLVGVRGTFKGTVVLIGLEAVEALVEAVLLALPELPELPQPASTAAVASTTIRAGNCLRIIIRPFA